MSEILNVDGLSAGYGALRVIHDLDFAIQAGERVGLVGLNGHGKTTFFYAVAGLTGWQRGSIKFNGQEVEAPAARGPGVIRTGLSDSGLPLCLRMTSFSTG
jgi:branched-chain amino acid transport system ATP-binding protein